MMHRKSGDTWLSIWQGIIKKNNMQLQVILG